MVEIYLFGNEVYREVAVKAGVDGFSKMPSVCSDVDDLLNYHARREKMWAAKTMVVGSGTITTNFLSTYADIYLGGCRFYQTVGDALVEYDEFRPDIILAEASLPDMGVIEFVRMIREIERDGRKGCEGATV